jgi:ferredoxin
MAIKIDKEKCVGCGLCASICSEIFAIGKDGKAMVKVQKKIPCVKEAIESCPVSAITE